MVYYFSSNVVSPAATIYVGKDKFESSVFSFPSFSIYISSEIAAFALTCLLDEELIKYGWEVDVW